MGRIDPREVAAHIDRVRRTWAPWREDLVVREVPGGWMSVQVGTEPAEFASQSRSRVNWLAPAGPVGEPAVTLALEGTRELGCRRTFVWLAPWACDAGTDAALRRAGAVPQGYVDQMALAREAGDEAPAEGRACEFEVRGLARDELPGVMERVRAWYGTEGAGVAVRFAEPGRVEIFGAFEGVVPVAIGLLNMDGGWAYLGAAGTDPQKRGRGAQTALIRARVRRAAELGAKWCGCETNNVVQTSLRNLRRCGFEELIVWRVYRWDAAG